MILTVAAIVAQASPAPAASASPPAAAAPTATLPPNPQVDAAAKAWLLSLQQGKPLAGATATKQMQAFFTPDNMKMVQSLLGTAALTSFDLKDSGTRGGVSIYVYRAAFADKKAFAFIYELDAKGQVAGMRIVPGQ